MAIGNFTVEWTIDINVMWRPLRFERLWFLSKFFGSAKLNLVLPWRAAVTVVTLITDVCSLYLCSKEGSVSSETHTSLQTRREINHCCLFSNYFTERTPTHECVFLHMSAAPTPSRILNYLCSFLQTNSEVLMSRQIQRVRSGSSFKKCIFFF